VQSEQWKDAQRQWADPDHEGDDTGVWSLWEPKFVDTLSHLPVVDEIMTMGTVLAIKFKDEQGGYGSQSAQTLMQPIMGSPTGDQPSAPSFGIHFRTLGNVAYFMTSLNTPSETIRSVQDRIRSTLQRAS